MYFARPNICSVSPLRDNICTFNYDLRLELVRDTNPNGLQNAIWESTSTPSKLYHFGLPCKYIHLLGSLQPPDNTHLFHHPSASNILWLSHIEDHKKKKKFKKRKQMHWFISSYNYMVVWGRCESPQSSPLPLDLFPAGPGWKISSAQVGF